MSYKSCPRTVKEVNENIDICNHLITKLEKREQELKVELAKNSDQKKTRFREEYQRLKDQLSHWLKNQSYNLKQLDDMKRAEG